MEANKVIELQEERAAQVKQMRAILDAADAETRELTGEEREQYDRLEADVDAKAARIADEQRIRALELGLEEREGLDPRRTRGGGETEADELRAAYKDAFESYMRFGIAGMGTEARSILSKGLDTSEKRDQTKGSNTSGGFIVPTDFQKQLVEHLVQAGTMRQTRATVIVTQAGENIQFPKTTAHGAATWQAEGSTFSSADETFGQVTLGAYKAVRLVKVSIELLQDNAVDLEGFLSKELGRAIGALENTAFVNGSGTSQPTGIIANATQGKQGATGQTAAVSADDVIDLFYSVPPQYRRSAEWQMADSTMKAIRKLKDSTGNYLWAPGIGGYGAGAVLANGAPDTLLGRPIWDDPDVPAMSASAKSILFGDYSAYWIRDVGVVGPVAGEKGVGAFMVRRLEERFADSGEVGFLAWHRTDGNLIDQTAAVKYYQNSAT